MSDHTKTIGQQLGSEQRRFLETLVEHGYWYGGAYGCGWTWGNNSQTLRLLESLLRRALVTTETRPSGIRQGGTTIYWLPSEAGQQLVAEWKAERAAKRAAAKAAAADRDCAECGHRLYLHKRHVNGAYRCASSGCGCEVATVAERSERS